MKKLKLLFFSCLILLAGCSVPDETQNSFSSGGSSEILETSTAPSPDLTTSSTEKSSFQEESSSSIADESKAQEPPAPAQTEESKDTSSQVESENRADISISQTTQPNYSPKPSETPDVTPSPDKETPFLDPVSKPTITPEPTPEPPPVFDISEYVSYSKSYGSRVGLKLDSTAVDCWDDPLMAYEGCIYLERDIRDRLDWYVESGFTSFWVWSVDIGGGKHQIFIGYA